MVSEEFKWLQEHYKELSEKYPGKVVAIVNHELVGIGNTLAEVREQASKTTTKRPLFGRIRKKRAMIL